MKQKKLSFLIVTFAFYLTATAHTYDTRGLLQIIE